MCSFHAKYVTQTWNTVSFEENVVPLMATEEITSYTLLYSFSHITAGRFIKTDFHLHPYVSYVSMSKRNETISEQVFATNTFQLVAVT